MTDSASTNAEIAAASDAEVLMLIERVTSSLKGLEDAPSVLARLTGFDRSIVMRLIAAGIDAYGNKEPLWLYANFMAVGAILAAEYSRQQRVISIEKAKRALPDYVDRDPSLPQFVDGGECPKCGGAWYRSSTLEPPYCPNCGATEGDEGASKAER